MLLEQHPLCHRMCKVSKETSGANKIMRNTIDLTSNNISMDLEWFSAVRLFHDFGRVSTIAKLTKMAAVSIG